MKNWFDKFEEIFQNTEDKLTQERDKILNDIINDGKVHMNRVQNMKKEFTEITVQGTSKL